MKADWLLDDSVAILTFNYILLMTDFYLCKHRILSWNSSHGTGLGQTLEGLAQDMNPELTYVLLV